MSFVLVVSDTGPTLAHLGPAATVVTCCVAGKPQARDVRNTSNDLDADGLARSPWPCHVVKRVFDWHTGPLVKAVRPVSPTSNSLRSAPQRARARAFPELSCYFMG